MRFRHCLPVLAVLACAAAEAATAAATPSQAAGTGSAGQAVAPDAAWQASYGQALQRFRGQDLGGAERAAREALDIARQAGASARPHEASSLNALGLIRQAQGHPEDALVLLGQALELGEQALGAHANTASVALNLGEVLEQLKRPQDALPRYERALAITDRLPADESNAALRRKALAALARVQLAAASAAAAGARGQSAQALHRRALALREAADPKDPVIAEHLNELALYHLERQEAAQAVPLLARALALAEASRGPHSMEAARLMASLALAHEGSGNEADAQALWRRALEAFEALGERPDALMGRAQALNQIASVTYRKRRFNEAEPMFLRALSLMEQAVGPQDAQLLPLLDNVQALYLSKGQAEKARPYAARAQALRTPPAR